MHAVRLHAFGPAENLTYERTADPVPAPGQVRITVAAAGVHLLDAAAAVAMIGTGRTTPWASSGSPASAPHPSPPSSATRSPKRPPPTAHLRPAARRARAS
ncbi:hypothetical protein EES45_15540 [Streptomyces sp. ADI97-07]|nr:hypothetical protein EES45_15540 [Streptomyces sp. ADI97-07]